MSPYRSNSHDNGWGLSPLCSPYRLMWRFRSLCPMRRRCSFQPACRSVVDLNYIASPVADEVVIVYCAAIIFIPDSRRISVRIIEIPQSTASAECFILQAIADIVIFVLQTDIGNGFRCSQSVYVISKADVYRSEPHRRKLSAVLPCERITPVCQRISYRIVGYRRVAV